MRHRCTQREGGVRTRWRVQGRELEGQCPAAGLAREPYQTGRGQTPLAQLLHSACHQQGQGTPGPAQPHSSAGTNLQGTGRGARAGLAADRALHLEERGGQAEAQAQRPPPSPRALLSSLCGFRALLGPSWSPALSFRPLTSVLHTRDSGLPDPQTTGFWVAARGDLTELSWPKTLATPAPQKTPAACREGSPTSSP